MINRWHALLLNLIVMLAAGVLSQPALAVFVQQGSKLVGTGAAGTAEQGYSAALSADGNTAIVGGPFDSSSVGAVWVFTRSGGVWSQQGKLVGSGAVGSTNEGVSVALSSDGNTAIVGGEDDNTSAGAVWIFTRSGNVWTQQGSKLIGTGAVGKAFQGNSVALSGDGNTAIVGGQLDNSEAGAAWVYTRSGNVWAQQGLKLVGTGAIGNARQGSSVALSSDGNTAIVGGTEDNGGTGATWAWTRSGGVWTQQSKLVGTGGVGVTIQGSSIALSGDGNTAVVGGYTDNSNSGAAWVFTRSAGVWSQQGLKLAGTGAVGHATQGISVALSGDGNTAIVGGDEDNSDAGAAWVYTRSGGVWAQYGSKLVGIGAVGAARQGRSVALSGDGKTAIVGGILDSSDAGAAWVFVRGPSLFATHDFNGDTKSDILWRNSGSGAVAGWLMSGVTVTSNGTIATVPANLQIVAQRDFDGDGKTDILLRDNTSGAVELWLMNGLTLKQPAISIGTVPTHWILAGASDFNGDGNADLLWRDSNTGAVAIWLMNGGTVLQTGTVGTVPLGWSITGTSPNGGIVWRNTSGALALWFMDGLTIAHNYNLGTVPSVWSVVGIGDFDRNGSDDLLWRHSTSGALAIWFLVNGVVTSKVTVATVPTTWSVDLTGDFAGGGGSDILWTHTSGARTIWFMNGATAAFKVNLGSVPTAWVIQSMSAE